MSRVLATRRPLPDTAEAAHKQALSPVAFDASAGLDADADLDAVLDAGVSGSLLLFRTLIYRLLGHAMFGPGDTYFLGRVCAPHIFSHQSADRRRLGAFSGDPC